MRHVFLAFTNPVAGREQEFNTWYDDFHLHEVIRYGSGMLGGRRFRFRPGQTQFPWRYLAWYDFECDSLTEYHRRPWLIDKPPLRPFAGLVDDDHVGWVYTPQREPIGEGWRGASVDPRDILVLVGPGHSSRMAEEAFFARYERDHLPRVASLFPGCVAGGRYREAADQRMNQPAPRWSLLGVDRIDAGNRDSSEQTTSLDSLAKAVDDARDGETESCIFEALGPYLAR